MTNKNTDPFLSLPVTIDGRVSPFIFTPNVTGFTQEDITLRYEVIRKFVEHQQKILGMLVQNGYNFSLQYAPMFGNNEIAILKDYSFIQAMRCYLPAGTWFYWPNQSMGFDIVSLKSYESGKNYKDTLVELIEAFKSKEYIKDGNRESEVKNHVQQRNPISINPKFPDDYFWSNFVASPTEYFYFNSHKNYIGKIVKFQNRLGQPLEMFYTIWRGKHEVKDKYLPLFPEKPYMIYNQQNITAETKQVIFLKTEEAVEQFPNEYHSINGSFPPGPETMFSACPGGLRNLPDADLSPISNRKLIVLAQPDSFDYDYINRLLRICNKSVIELEFSHISLRGYRYIPAKDIIESPEEYNLNPPAPTSVSTSILFADKNQEIPNANRKRNVLLDPVIESGTSIWLFSKEKVGKTYFGLSIAYAVGKGNTRLGNWKSSAPREVLYVDGEMPGDKLDLYIKMIMNGFGDNDEGETNRHFKVLPLFESGKEYESILDEEMQDDINKSIRGCDLVILDNYYSLNNNSQNVKPFNQWLRNHNKNGITFLILDHTNSLGDIQGSANKRRAATLGIKLEKTENNLIHVSYEFDRLGVGRKSPAHDLSFCFTDTTFSIIPFKPKEPDETSKIPLKLKLYAYLLALSEMTSNAEIIESIGIPSATLYSWLNSFQNPNEHKKPQKTKPLNLSDEEKSIVLREKDLLKILPKEELIREARRLYLTFQKPQKPGNASGNKN